MTQHLTVRHLFKLLSAVLASLGCVVSSDCLGNETSDCAVSPILVIENPDDPDGCTNGEDGCTAFSFSPSSPDGPLTTSFRLSNLGDLNLYYNASLSESTDPRFALLGEPSGTIEPGASAELTLTVDPEQVGYTEAEIVIESNAVNPEVRIKVTADSNG